MQYVFTLGRQSELSVAELTSFLERQAPGFSVSATSDVLLVIESPTPLSPALLKQLGGSDRLAQVLAIQTSPWQPEDVANRLSPTEHKTTLGISFLDDSLTDNPRQFALDLKKVLKERGQKVRVVLPKKGLGMNTAQVLFNNLIDEKNSELVIAKAGAQYFLARTIAVQDIQAYEARDSERPIRDAVVGMLPVKLAQIMINLALPSSEKPLTLLDPFCGLGTVLQEGWLLGHRMIGSDASVDMTRAAKQNLAYIGTHFQTDPVLTPSVQQQSVAKLFPISWNNTVDAIVTEPFMGKALNAPLTDTQAAKQFNELGELYLAFFKHAHSVLKPQGRIVFALPAFRKSRERQSDFNLFPKGFLDAIANLGYVLDQLGASERGSLLYARPDALVGRELTRWIKR